MCIDELLKIFRTAMFDYEMHTGMKPTRAYLGQNEYKSLCAILKDKPVEFSGVKIFEVNDEQEHFRVCN